MKSFPLSSTDATVLLGAVDARRTELQKAVDGIKYAEENGQHFSVGEKRVLENLQYQVTRLDALRDQLEDLQ